MNNVIACFIFNFVGLGTFYFLSFFWRDQKASVKEGTSIFWGSWGSLFLTYGLWLLMPENLNLACYVTFVFALVGCFFFFKEKGLSSFFQSDYFIAFLCLLPFLVVVSYHPKHCDEFSHWVALPKVFYYQNSLIPTEAWHTGNYTPFWTLEAVFFQFFSPFGFDPSLIYAVRINLMLSFFFFIKERFNLNVLKASLFVLGTLIVFFVTKSAQNLLVEFPLCLLLGAILFLRGDEQKNNAQQNLIFFFIALLSLVMIKKPMIAVFPAAFYVLWKEGYKKQLFSFMVICAAFYLSWKVKTAHMNEPWQYPFTLKGLWSETALGVYHQIGHKLLQDSPRLLLFIVSMGVIYREKKKAFLFYVIFSLLYFMGLVTTYAYAFPGYYEAAIKASYVRYIKIIYVPAYVYAIYIMISKASMFSPWEEALLKKRRLPLYSLSFIVPFLMVCFYSPSLSRSVPQELLVYQKLKNHFDLHNKKIMVIEQGEGNESLRRFKYYAYEDTRQVDGGSYGLVANEGDRVAEEKNAFVDQLKSYDLIIVPTSNTWLNNMLSEFLLYKMQRVGKFMVFEKSL